MREDTAASIREDRGHGGECEESPEDPGCDDGAELTTASEHKQLLSSDGVRPGPESQPAGRMATAMVLF